MSHAVFLFQLPDTWILTQFNDLIFNFLFKYRNLRLKHTHQFIVWYFGFDDSHSLTLEMKRLVLSLWLNLV